MVALAVYLLFLALACAYAMVDWRRGWLLVSIAGVLQDPVRKLTSGSPVWVSFLVVILYMAAIFSARHAILAEARDFGRRFGRIYTIIVLLIFLLIVSALNPRPVP